MKKRLFILISLLLLLTGCSVKYNIIIGDTYIKDEIKLTEKTSIVNKADEERQEEFEDELQYWELDYNYYEKTKFTEKDETGYRYDGYFTYKEYALLAEITRCYSDFKLEDGDTLKLTTSDVFLCANGYEHLNGIDITIETDYKVIDNNADKVDGNKYTWYITGKNYNNKPIMIEIDRYNKADKGKGKLTAGKVVVILIFILLIVIKISLNKKEKKEKANY